MALIFALARNLPHDGPANQYPVLKTDMNVCATQTDLVFGVGADGFGLRVLRVHEFRAGG
jgi:hypothetical protein